MTVVVEKNFVGREAWVALIFANLARRIVAGRRAGGTSRCAYLADPRGVLLPFLAQLLAVGALAPLFLAARFELLPFQLKPAQLVFQFFLFEK